MPIVPCWYCGNKDVRKLVTDVVWYSKLRFNDIRDVDWYWCSKCGATTSKNPNKLGRCVKVKPWRGLTKWMVNR